MKYCPNCKSDLFTRHIDHFERLLCSDKNCGYVHWGNPVAVVLILVDLEGKYILARNASWPKSRFSLISGYVDANETLEQTALREVNEELGLVGRSPSYIGSYPFTRNNQIVIAYCLKAKGKIVLNDELSEVIYLSSTELLQYDFNEFDLTANIIRDWKKGRVSSENI